MISNCYGQSFIPIKAGQSSPFNGFVITRSTEKMIRQRVENLDLRLLRTTGLAEAQGKLIAQQKTHIGLMKAHNGQLAKLAKGSKWENTGYFLLGALISGFMGYATIRYSK